MLARCDGQLLIYLALLVLKRSVVLTARVEFTGSGTRASVRAAMTLSLPNSKVVYIPLLVGFRLLALISRFWEGDSW